MSSGRVGTLDALVATYVGFGLRFGCEFPLPEMPTTDVDALDLVVRLASISEVASAFSGSVDPPAVHESLLGDGCRYTVERGRDGDYRIEYGDRAAFHLATGGGSLLCAPADVAEPAWRRFFLDTGLGTAALVQGFEALHAAAFLGATGVVAICADTSGGKSSLLAEMLERGRVLVCDDILALSVADGAVLGHAGPPLLNLAQRLPDGTDAARVGRVIAELDGELWVAVASPPVAATPVAAVVVLQRQAGVRLGLDQIPANPLPLLAHALSSGPTADRERARFELFSTLVEQARLFVLSAPLDAPTAATADLIATL